MSHQWAALAVSLVANLLIIGVFVGSLRQTVKGLEVALGKLSERMDHYDTFSDASQTDRADIRARLLVLERSVAEIPAMRDQLTRIGTVMENEHKHMNQKLDILTRDMGAQQRQMANIATQRHEYRPGGDA